MTKEEVLNQCVVNGLVVMLPDVQLDRKVYQELAKSLELIGGKWNRKEKGFLFVEDPTELLSQISSGEKRNLKKEYQFFATPDNLADELVELANIKENDLILEPSAGQGAIIEAVLRKNPQANIFAFELMDINSIVLTRKGFNHELTDFLKVPGKPTYDKIIANPPFSKNSDIEHIIHMYQMLKSGGRLVSVSSRHWKNSNNKKESKFREWIDEVGAEVIEVDAGAFKSSGTNISTYIIIVDKK